MSNVINRVTGELLLSVNTPDYPKQDYIINPDLSAVKNIPPQYWKIDGDRVLDMSIAEKAVVNTRIAEEIIVNNAANPSNILAEHTEILADINQRLIKLEGN